MILTQICYKTLIATRREFPQVSLKIGRSPSKNLSAHVVVRIVNLTITHLFTGSTYSFIPVTAKEGKIIIGSTYAAPSADFMGILAELQHTPELTELQSSPRGGLSFVAGSPHYGDVGMKTSRKTSSQNTSQHIQYNLAISSLHNTDATFEKLNSKGEVIATGCPDLILVNLQTILKIPALFVSDIFSGSDHKYISYTYTKVHHYTHIVDSSITTRGTFHKVN